MESLSYQRHALPTSARRACARITNDFVLFRAATLDNCYRLDGQGCGRGRRDEPPRREEHTRLIISPGELGVFTLSRCELNPVKPRRRHSRAPQCHSSLSDFFGVTIDPWHRLPCSSKPGWDPRATEIGSRLAGTVPRTIFARRFIPAERILFICSLQGTSRRT